MDAIDLLWGYPNHVGEARVYVMHVGAASAELALVDHDDYEHPTRAVRVGDALPIAGVDWVVESITPLPSFGPEPRPPGTGGGTPVVRLTRARP